MAPTKQVLKQNNPITSGISGPKIEVQQLKNQNVKEYGLDGLPLV